MKQIVMMILTLITVVGYQIFKVVMTTAGTTNFFIPILITMTVICTCGLIHYFDKEEIK